MKNGYCIYGIVKMASFKQNKWQHKNIFMGNGFSWRECVVLRRKVTAP
jgi:hypothetical protein